MNKAFNQLDEAAKAPEHIKDMLVSEIDFIRDSLTVVNFFMGQFMQTAVVMLQESQAKPD
jgi:uncharacterized protein